MAQLNEHPPLKKMKVCTPDKQYARQRISNEWRCNGLERYPYMKGLQDEMDILGGTCDLQGASPRRFQVIGSLEEDFPIK